MKYIKTYERRRLPNVGDYVICKDNFFTNIHDASEHIDFNNFIDNNIGEIDRKVISGEKYIVKYENIPEELSSYFLHDGEMDFTIKEILHFSKNREDLEIILLQKKYNL